MAGTYSETLLKYDGWSPSSAIMLCNIACNSAASQLTNENDACLSLGSIKIGVDVSTEVGTKVRALKAQLP